MNSTGFGRCWYRSPGKSPIKTQATAARPMAASMFQGGSLARSPESFAKNM